MTMNFSIKVDPKQTILMFDRFEASFRTKLKTIVDNYGAAILQNIKSEMLAPKHGRWYPRPGGGKYRASAPGEAPAVRTGFLLNSIRKQLTANINEVVSRVFTNVYYMKYLENRYILNRQAFTPALNLKKSAFIHDITLLVNNYSNKL